MALRSVLLEPPPAEGPRRTVVLRAGGPTHEGHVADWVTGILGAALLVVAGALVAILPEEDVIIPQFHVTVRDVPTNFTTETFAFAEGEESRQHEFTYEVPADNVHFILIEVGFRQDDVVASLPDKFTVELFDPQGEAVDESRPVENALATPSESATLGYDAVPLSARISFTVATKPEEQIVAGIDAHETAEEAAARLEAQFHEATAGTWRVRVTLLDAGDCPPPGGEDLNRQLSCGFETQGDGTDTGNEFSIALFQYTAFVMQAEEV